MKSNYLITFIFILFLFLDLRGQDNRIRYNDQDLFLNGMNLAWISFANDVTNLNVTEFTQVLDELKASGANSLRWWLHTNGIASPQFTNDSVSGISQQELDNMKIALDLAEERGIGIVMCLWSFDMLQSNAGTANLPRNRLLLEDTVYTQAYINNALIPMINHLKGHNAIICWEILNEPEGMASDVMWAGWTTENTLMDPYIQRFINLTAGAIHRTDTSALVSNGSWSFIASSDEHGYRNYYSDEELITAGGDTSGTLDFYMVHYYDWGGVDLSPFHHPASYWNLDKPIVIAEFSASGPITGIDIVTAYDTLYKNGYAGALSWQWNGEFGGLPAAEPGISYLHDNYPADIEIIIDSSNINFTPMLVNAIKDTSFIIRTDSLIVKYVDLNSIFTDVEDTTLTISVANISNNVLINAEVNANDTLELGVKPNLAGISTVTVRATDSGGKIVDALFYVSVFDSASDDIAQFRKITASSFEDNQKLTLFANDGNLLTRWSSEYSNDQWIMIEFEKVRSIQRVLLNWETAYGRVFYLLTSIDGVTWDTAYYEAYGNGGYDLFVFPPTNAKYLMLDGIYRNRRWGYSLWDFKVFETPGTNTNPALKTFADTLEIYANSPLNKKALDFFTDATQGDQLIYEVTVDDIEGNSDWLTLIKPYHQDSAAFTGTPLVDDIGSFKVTLRAYDRYDDYVDAEFVIKIMNPITSVNSITMKDIRVYPNPVMDKLLIEGEDIQVENAEIIDIQGRLVSEFEISKSGNLMLDVSYLEKGIYYLVLKNSQYVITKKFIKK